METARKRILVVDDEESVTLLLQRVLSRVGYDVTTTSTGEEGIKRLDAERFDLLIIDKSLPRLHGHEVIRHARARFPRIAVVLITANPDFTTSAEHRLDGYLAKPFRSIKDVERAVRDALETSKGASTPQPPAPKP